MLLYELQSPPDYSITECEETRVSSLKQCATVGLVSRDVRFFFDQDNKICRWNCSFLYTGIVDTPDGWYHYGIKHNRNAALHKPANASSVNGNNHDKYGTQHAAYGVMPNSYVDMFHSDLENSPWFTVVLDKTYIIQFVRVINRRDPLGERFHDVAFEVSDDGNIFEKKAFFKGPGMTDQVIEILFDHPTLGTYVKIEITEGTNNIISFVENEIYTLD